MNNRHRRAARLKARYYARVAKKARKEAESAIVTAGKARTESVAYGN